MKIAESIFKRKDTPSLYATASQQWFMCMHLCSIDENVLPESNHVETIYVKPDYESFYKTNCKTKVSMS